MVIDIPTRLLAARHALHTLDPGCLNCLHMTSNPCDGDMYVRTCFVYVAQSGCSKTYFMYVGCRDVGSCELQPPPSWACGVY